MNVNVVAELLGRRRSAQRKMVYACSGFFDPSFDWSKGSAKDGKAANNIRQIRSAVALVLLLAFTFTSAVTNAADSEPPVDLLGTVTPCSTCFENTQVPTIVSPGQAFSETVYFTSIGTSGSCGATYTFGGSALYTGFPGNGGAYIPGAISSSANPTQVVVPPQSTAASAMVITYTVSATQPIPPHVAVGSLGYALSTYGTIDIGPCVSPYTGVTHRNANFYAHNSIFVDLPPATIQLLGLHQIEPDKLLLATALVSDGSGNPLVGATVHLRVDAVPNSGGHMHGDDTSPLRRGKLNGIGPEIVAAVPTGADGVYGFAFNAPSVSGTYAITAFCDDRPCTQEGTDTVDAKIDGLEVLPSSLFYSAVPANSHPPGTHYVTADTADKLELLAFDFHNVPYPVGGDSFVVTAGSLVWGGLYDIDQDWNPPHQEHRRGTVVDLRANGLPGSISVANFSKFRAACKQLHVDCKVHSAGTSNQHMHVRLLGRAE